VPFRNIENVVLVGAGNVAAHLGLALASQGIRIVEVCNRTPGTGQDLADRLGATFIADIMAITKAADLYILAVSDSAIATLAGSMHLNDKMVVHTSGTTGMNVLANISENIGVFYPLQTFSPGRATMFRGIPVCLESNSPEGEQQLRKLAERLTDIVQFLDSDHRKLLHLSAVFASNFTNFMYTIAEDLIIAHGIPFELMKPLISHTAEIARQEDVFRQQTGPALRGDLDVLSSHRKLLAEHPDYLEIYNLISNNIIKYKEAHGKL